MNRSLSPSRRRFITLAGVGFAWHAVRTGFAAANSTAIPSANIENAAEALQALTAGNQRYVTGANLHHDFGPERPGLVAGQRPFAVILSCSDSRVAPELAFDQSRGRLFVIRVAGNFVDDSGLASVEYGTSVLGASLVMVLGHTECGALKAAVDVVTRGTKLPGHLPKLVAHLEPAVREARGEGSGLVEAAIRQNVRLNVRKLQNSEPVLAELVKTNRVLVVGAIYDLLTGRVIAVT
ncbi:MAG TPA: carbonic anhydrase [Chthoniobacterales bacterium]